MYSFDFFYISIILFFLVLCVLPRNNDQDIKYIFEDRDKKVFKLLDRDIKDPWYSGNFLDTYNDLDEGINKLINELMEKYYGK